MAPDWTFDGFVVVLIIVVLRWHHFHEHRVINRHLAANEIHVSRDDDHGGTEFAGEHPDEPEVEEQPHPDK